MTSAIENALAELRRERARLSDQLRDTEQAIEALIRLGGASRHTPSPETKSAPKSVTVVSGGRAAGASATIMRTFRAVGTPMDIDGVYDDIVARGWESTSNDPRRVVASTISKLIRQGKLHKVSPTEYALAGSVDANVERDGGEVDDDEDE